MTQNDNEAWNEFAPFYQAAVGNDSQTVRYGFDIGTEEDFRLLGEVKDKRVLDLGCGGGQNAVALAKQGARVIGIDYSSEQLRYARKLAEQEEVRIEFKEGDLGDLAFVPADNMDVVLSTLVLDFVDDLSRLFRAVHRVVNEGGIFVFSMRHPVNNMVNHSKDSNPFAITRSYFTREPIREPEGGGTVLTSYQHTISDIYAGLKSSGFAVEILLEPEPLPNTPRSIDWRESYTRIPSTLIVRARNIGS